MLEESGPSPAGELHLARAEPSGLEQVVAALVTVTVVIIAAGSAEDSGIKSAAGPVRWLSLAALLAAAAGLAWRSRERAPVTTLERHGAAFGAGLVVLWLASATWSVAPRLSAERAVSVGVALAAAGAIAFSAGRRAGFIELVMKAILAAVAVLLLASLVFYAVQPSSAFQAGIVRFRGIEENPDTLPLLAAYGLPLAAWLFLTGERVLERAASIATFVGIFLLMGATGSRGGAVGGAAGMLVVVAVEAGRRRRALVELAAVVVALAATVVITPLMSHLPGTRPYVGPSAVAVAVPNPSTTTTATATTGSTATPTTSTATTTTSTATTTSATTGGPTTPSAGPTGPGATTTSPVKPVPVTPAPTPAPARTPAEIRVADDFPNGLGNEVGRPRVGDIAHRGRDLLSSSGRLTAWIGAIGQGDARPLLGYGFGTEDRVFIDRYYVFSGGRPENVWIGLYLQLGIVGVVAFACFLGWALLRGLRALRTGSRAHRLRSAACAGVVVAGCAETLIQSYVYSAGDIAMLSFWICLGLLLVAADPEGKVATQ